MCVYIYIHDDDINRSLKICWFLYCEYRMQMICEMDVDSKPYIPSFYVYFCVHIVSMHIHVYLLYEYHEIADHMVSAMGCQRDVKRFKV